MQAQLSPSSTSFPQSQRHPNGRESCKPARTQDQGCAPALILFLAIAPEKEENSAAPDGRNQLRGRDGHIVDAHDDTRLDLVVFCRLFYGVLMCSVRGRGAVYSLLVVPREYETDEGEGNDLRERGAYAHEADNNGGADDAAVDEERAEHASCEYGVREYPEATQR
jgi:hypothetical protein